MLVATSTVAVLVSRFADAFTPMSNLATRDQMADREKRECRQAPWDPEPAATHTHKEHLRSLAARLKNHGGLCNTATERWVKKWDSIAGMLEHNLIGAGGLLLETVDDLVRELTPGGQSGDVMGQPMCLFPLWRQRAVAMPGDRFPMHRNGESLTGCHGLSA